jgi:hypothetical protein
MNTAQLGQVTVRRLCCHLMSLAIQSHQLIPRISDQLHFHPEQINMPYIRQIQYFRIGRSQKVRHHDSTLRQTSATWHGAYMTLEPKYFRL